MGDGAHTTIEIASDRFAGDRPQSYTVVRAKLDQWLAEKVTEKGADGKVHEGIFNMVRPEAAEHAPRVPDGMVKLESPTSSTTIVPSSACCVLPT